jgi:hypothetical protein
MYRKRRIPQFHYPRGKLAYFEAVQPPPHVIMPVAPKGDEGHFTAVEFEYTVELVED